MMTLRKVSLVRPLRWAGAAAAALVCGLGTVFGAEEAKAEEKENPRAVEFRDQILPIVRKHCYECHDADVQKADLNLAVFTDYAMVLDEPEVWQKVLERVQAFEMPPKKAGELSFGSQGQFVRWLRNLPRQDADCDRLGSDRTLNFYKGYVMSRRLNRSEYRNTIRDLFGVEVEVEDLLPADGGGGEGFDTSGDALFISPIHIDRYLAVADRVLETVLPPSEEGLDEDRLFARAQILEPLPSPGEAPRVAAGEIVGRIARLAFRRPVAPDEVERLLGLFDRAWDRGDGFEAAVRLALKGVLLSPHFLFLIELEPKEPGVHPLPPLALASRLSYFLWSSMPDEELLRLAESGALAEPEVYQRQVRRLLSDPRADALGGRFALQWLDLHRLGGETRPDPLLFPEFAEVRESMLMEVRTYFNHVIREDRPLLELIDSNYSFVDRRLARLYGVEAGHGSFRRVEFTDRKRGGLVGMAAVHALTSYPMRTSPVLRGRWILESLLGDKVPPPPPDVPALEDAGEAAAHATLRQQLELHRVKSECASCHDRMDPLGFGLENFDVLGRWRDSENGQPIDASGTLPSGKQFSGPDGLKDVLLERQEAVIRHLVQKMAGYALGRDLNKFDRCVVDRTLEALKANGYRASILVEQIALSFPFRHRFYPRNDT